MLSSNRSHMMAQLIRVHPTSHMQTVGFGDACDFLYLRLRCAFAGLTMLPSAMERCNGLQSRWGHHTVAHCYSCFRLFSINEQLPGTFLSCCNHVSLHSIHKGIIPATYACVSPHISPFMQVADPDIKKAGFVTKWLGYGAQTLGPVKKKDGTAVERVVETWLPKKIVKAYSLRYAISFCMLCSRNL